MTYREVATAPGVWTLAVRFDTPIPFPLLHSTLAEFSARHRFPVTAFAATEPDGVVGAALVRDPSITHGTPDLPVCEEAGAALLRETGWCSIPPPSGELLMMAGIGLREGYAPHARIHHQDEVQDVLAEHEGRWSLLPVRLLSLRPLPDGSVQPYDEPGVMVTARTPGLPRITAGTPQQAVTAARRSALAAAAPARTPALAAITAVAARLRQHRFVVHDWSQQRTYVLRHTDPEEAR